MIRKYEIACEEAGLSKEKIKEIAQVFDTQKKNLKYEQAALEKAYAEEGLCVLSISGVLGSAIEGDFEIPDPEQDVHEMVYQKMLLDKLQGFLSEMEDCDRRLLLAFYDKSRCAQMNLLKELGISRETARWRVKKLFEELKDKFRDEIE